MKRVWLFSFMVLSLSLPVLGEETMVESESYWERIKARATLEKDKLEVKIDTDKIFEDIKNKASELSDDVTQKVKESISQDEVLESIDDTVYDIAEEVDIDTREQKIISLIKDKLPESELTTTLSMTIQAVSDLVRATIISDKEMKIMAKATVEALDKNSSLSKEESKYGLRLVKISKTISTPNKLKLNIKVYENDEVNAFATADGSVRIYSAIMDMMTDEEVLFVIGHEVGHVDKKHSKDSYRVAYALSGLRKGAIAQGGMVGSIAESVVGQLSSSLLNAKFSRNEERSADAYALDFLMHNGMTKEEAKSVAISALGKLQSSTSNMLSSHPDSSNRIEAIHGK